MYVSSVIFREESFTILLGVDKVNTLRKNEIFIFPSCIIFLSPSVTAGK